MGDFNSTFLLEMGDMSVLLFVSLSGVVDAVDTFVAVDAVDAAEETEEEMEKGGEVVEMDTEGGCRGEQSDAFLSIVVSFSSVFMSTGSCQEILPVRRWM